MSTTTRRILLVATGVVLGLLTVLILFPLLGPGPGPLDDPHVLPAPYPAPGARLTDHRGEEATLPGDFDGVTVVFFGYTHCPDVCPLTMAHVAEVRRRLPPDLAERFRAVLVTVDPLRDTPPVLAEYVAGFDTSFVGLTGSEEEIGDVATAWGAWAERAAQAPGTAPADTIGASGGAVAPPPDTAAEPYVGHGGAGHDGAGPGARGYLVDHTARSFVVDGRGRIVATFPPSTPADVMLPTVRRLLEEGA